MLDLAPTNLPVLRAERFDGACCGTSLTAFAAEDQQHLRQLYQMVQGVHAVWQEIQAAPDLAYFRAYLAPFGEERFESRVRVLGQATRRQDPASLLCHVLHDAKEGGLAVLLGAAGWLRKRPANERLLTTCGLAARDHLRSLRQAVADLAPATEAAASAHCIAELVGRWDQAALHVDNRIVRVVVQTTGPDAVAATDREAGVLARLFYNHLHNAARFSANNRVEVTIFPVNPGLLRWVIVNPLTMGQQRSLETWTGGDLARLYEGFQGLGLRTCADLVAAAFGLGSGRQAVEQGYLGARVVDGRYHAWFHWPALVAATQPAS